MRLFREWKTKKIRWFPLFIFVFVVGIFGVALPAFAEGSGESGVVARILDWSGLTSGLQIALNWVLYAVLRLFQLFASAGLVLFEFIIKPANISGPNGILNTAVVYDLWKFIRDFFNLFFILILLFSAFATIFQIEQFSIKKIFLNILLAALLINFSFPITRFLIDTANVPMYYFAGNMTTTSGGGMTDAMKEVLKASNLSMILLGVSDENQINNDFLGKDGTTSKLLLAIVFMFIFAIAIVVLALLLLIRMVALTLLLIFSSVGFLSGVFPGIQKYTHEWWETFWRYNFFGPVALLMLLVSVRFMAAVNNSGFFSGGAQDIAANITTGAESATMLASMVAFSLPIILLWFTIIMAGQSSMVGASMVSGLGQRAVKWGGRNLTGYGALSGGVARRWKAYQKERDKRSEAKFAAGNIGKSFGSWANKTQDTVHGNLPIGGRKAAQERLKDMETKEIYETLDEFKKSGISDSELKKNLAGKDKVTAAAAAIALADRGAIDGANELSLAIAALGNNTKEISAVFEKASGGAIRGISAGQYKAFRESQVVKDNSTLRKTIDKQMIEQGNAKVIVDYEVSIAPNTVVDREGNTVSPAEGAVQNTIRKIKSAKDMAKNESLFEDPRYGAIAVAAVEAQGPSRVTAVKKASGEEGTSVGSKLRVVRPEPTPEERVETERRAAEERTERERRHDEEVRQRVVDRQRETRERRAGGV